MADEQILNVNNDNRRSNTEAALIGLTKDFSYLQRDISEIKKDVKEIKNETISRREFEEYKKDTDKRVSFVTTSLYTVGFIIISAVIGAVLKTVIK